MENDLLALTSDIVSAHVSNNSVATAELPNLISSVYAALSKTSEPLVEELVKAEPAVSIRSSVKSDYIVCLEDGTKLKMLKRYLMTNYQMTPDDYRAKWGLPKDYPMVAPAYAATRRELAQKIGLGRRKVVTETQAPAAKALKAAKARVTGDTEAAKPMRATKKLPTVEAPVVEKKKRGRPAKVKAPVEA